MQSNLVCDLAELLDHGCRHFVHGLHAAELVSFREEVAFERRRAGGKVGDKGGIRSRYFQEVFRWAESGGFDSACDVEHGEAFRHDYGVEIDIPALQTLLHRNNVPRLVEEIFARLERTAVADVVPENEGFLAAKDTCGLEFAGDAAGGVTRAQHHEGLSGRFNRGQ